MSSVETPNVIFRLRVTLEEVAPPVVRLIEVPSTYTLAEVHAAIQLVMSFDNSHLHEFRIGKQVYGEQDEHSFKKRHDEAAVTLAELVKVGDELAYVYDLGNPWTHTILIEERFEAEPDAPYPRCVGGQGAAPPEGAGGPAGYAALLDKLADKDSETLAWLGEDFSPFRFDLDEANADLAALVPLKLDAEMQDLTHRLGRQRLDEAIEKDLLSRGSALSERLLQILADERLWTEDAPGNGFAPVHAVTLLVRLGEERAIPLMLEVLEVTDGEELLHDVVLSELPKLGQKIIEPVFARLAQIEDDSDLEADLVLVLSGAGVRDERIYEALSRLLVREPTLGAIGLAGYGDERALPALRRTLAALSASALDLEAAEAVVTVCEAIDGFGGDLHDKDRDLYERALDLVENAQHESAEPLVRRVDIGRNDPCYCGSGKKYKKCHMEADEADPYVN